MITVNTLNEMMAAPTVREAIKLGIQRNAQAAPVLELTAEDEAQNILNAWTQAVDELLEEVLGKANYVAYVNVMKFPKAEVFTPTVAQTTAFQQMFDYFNLNLFAGKLPQVVLNFSRRKSSIGFFASNRWGERAAVTAGTYSAGIHEISLNPEYLSREPQATCGTLVHEMCHLERTLSGKEPRNGYHDKIWALMMLNVGLRPVSIDQPGKMTGQKVSHEIIRGDIFQNAYIAMPVSYLLPFSHIIETAAESKKAKSKNKVKYTCVGCEANIWGKSGLHINCDDCQEKYHEDGVSYEMED